MGIRLEFQIPLEVRRKGAQSSLLAGQQAAIGMFGSWASSVGKKMLCSARRDSSRAISGEGAAAAGGGAVMVTLVLAVAVWFLSSDTLQVIVTVPAGAPAELNVAVASVPVTVPAAAE